MDAKGRGARLSSNQLALERLATNLRVESELFEALDILSDLCVVVFKGGCLTRLIYGDLRRRASADNDIWVPRAQATEALHRLEAQGYRCLPQLDSQAALRRVGQVALWKDGDLRRPSLDLHQEPFSRRYFAVPEGLLKENLLTVDFHGREVATFNEGLALVHMVAHWVQHHFEPAHLKEIRAAHHAFSKKVPEPSLRKLAAQTCSLPAYDLALASAGVTANDSGRTLGFRASFTNSVMQRWPESAPHVVLKLLSLFLVAPERLPTQVLAALYLESDELHSRYGSGNRASLLVRHLCRSLRR